MEFLNEKPSLRDFTARLHKRDTNLSLNDIENALVLNSDKYIITQEKMDTNPHYHVVMYGVNKDKFIEKIKNIYPEFKGNKYFSITNIKNNRKALKYACKEICEYNGSLENLSLDYRIKGFSDADVMLYYDLSHKKFDKTAWLDAMDKIKDEIRCPKEMFVEICMLYKTYGKPINFSHIKNIVISNTYNKNDFMNKARELFFDY